MSLDQIRDDAAKTATKYARPDWKVVQRVSCTSPGCNYGFILINQHVVDTAGICGACGRQLVILGTWRRHEVPVEVIGP